MHLRIQKLTFWDQFHIVRVVQETLKTSQGISLALALVINYLLDKFLDFGSAICDITWTIKYFYSNDNHYIL